MIIDAKAQRGKRSKEDKKEFSFAFLRVIGGLFFCLVGCREVAVTAVPTSIVSAAPTSTPTAASSPTATVPPPAPTMMEKEMRFLALGDSYTIGESVAETERWPVQLAARLQEQGVRMAAPEIIAKTGWTTDELAAGIQAAQPHGPYDLVSLLIGVNNQYRGRSQEEYQAQFAALLQQAIAFAGGDPVRVIVLSIPDWGVTPFAARQDGAAIAAAIDAFNAISRAEAQKAGVWYVDVTAVSRQAATDPTLIADDGLHPSGKMYTAWAELVLPVVLEKVIRMP